MNETERMESQDKMNPADVGLFARMLGIRELPVMLIEKYWERKKLMDKIDALVTPGTLVDMIFACGFNVDTMRFEEPVSPIAPEFTEKIESASSGEQTEIEPPEVILIGTVCTVLFEGEEIMDCKVNGHLEKDGQTLYSVETPEEELIEELTLSEIKVG